MSFWGMDSSSYPGDYTMEIWKRYLTWTGFYLGPAPDHNGTDWMDRRATLVGLGWEFANTRKGHWRTANSPILKRSLDNKTISQSRINMPGNRLYT